MIFTIMILGYWVVVDGTIFGSCPVMDLEVSGVELTTSAIRQVVVTSL
jgi:hypothetical protein